MAERTVRVDTTGLQHGAGRFERHHGDLVDELTKIQTGQESLQEGWSGSAADLANEMWEGLHPRLATHFDHIATLAAGLKTGAAIYISADDDSASGIAGTEA
jgi:WXG100 family type VII secretion target